MKKILVVVAIVVVLGGFVVFQKVQTPVSLPQNSNDNGNTLNGPMMTPGMGNTSMKYKDGTYTGPAVDASMYGTMQVQVTVKGGKIADVNFLQIPSGSGHTNEVSSQVQPILKQEVIVNQSANIDIVSGATQDTQSFIQSLQGALDQAKI